MSHLESSSSSLSGGDRPRTSSAIFSPGRDYRYVLLREWSDAPRRLVVIGLNPSTADETEDDPTIRRCIALAKREQCGGLVMLNLFAFRATQPRDMLAASDPIGPENDKYIAGHTWAPDRIVVAAWGAHGGYLNRAANVLRHLPPGAVCLGVTKGGQPKHPLYLRADTPFVPLAALSSVSSPEQTE